MQTEGAFRRRTVGEDVDARSRGGRNSYAHKSGKGK